MFRKVLLLLALPLLGTLLYAVTGCRRTKARICSIALWSVDIKDTIGSSKSYFAFDIRNANLCLAAVGDPFATACQAFKICYSPQNDLDRSSFQLTFDRRIIFNSDTLEPNTNIMTHPAFKEFVPITGEGFECSSLHYRIGVADTNTTHRLVFDEGEYHVFFTCLTTDGARLEAISSAVFR